MKTTQISFEFFPPRSDVQQRRFWTTLGCLQTLNPSYISMTWGALGTTSQASIDVLQALCTDATVPITAHLTCVGHTATSIRKTIAQLDALGITRFLALRGDAQQAQKPENGLEHASELVEILAENKKREIGVAAYPENHPESADSDADLHWLRHKMEAGASEAVTQFFFEADTFLRFRDKAVKAGITGKLVPGILPIHDIEKVQQFSKQCGASVPLSLVELFESGGDAQSKASLAVDHSLKLCQQLQREGVSDFHIYTLNQSGLSFRLAQALLGSRSEQSVDAAA